MIKNLDWMQQDGDPEIKYMDTSTVLQIQLTVDGAPFDLNNVTSLIIQVANDDGFVISRNVDLSTVDDLTTGIINFPIDSDIMTTLVPDDYQIEVWATVKPIMVTTTATTAILTILDDQLQPHTSIFPSDGIIGFTIGENLTSTDGSLVSTITFQDFQNQFALMIKESNDAIAKVTSDAENRIATAVGPQGPKGDTGETGAQGPVGPVGPKGDKGDTGPQGPQGIQGLKGDKGDTGKDGTSVNIKGSFDSADKLPQSGTVGDAYLIKGDLYVWTGTAWKDAGGIQGPQGIAGPQGIQGPTGPQGPRGNTGPAGPKGDIGPQGVQGPQGTGLAIKGSVATADKLPATGATGDAYLVAGELYIWNGTKWNDTGNIQGPQGIQGIQGPKGDTGPVGPAGPKGDTGVQGPQGVQGPAGKDGLTQDLSSFYHQNTDDTSAQSAAKAAKAPGIYWYPVNS